jgi:two-component system response regulator YesN
LKGESFIKEHYQENITRTDIASTVYLTPEYMAKIFKKETGVSLKQYLSDYRISKAKELLTEPNIRVTDAAQQVGFDNFSYFSTVFKKATGLTPIEYHLEVTGKTK